jgi:hypothetical protein
MLSSDAIKRIKEYVVAHLDEPIEVAVLAGIAARSPSISPGYSRKPSA